MWYLVLLFLLVAGSIANHADQKPDDMPNYLDDVQATPSFDYPLHDELANIEYGHKEFYTFSAPEEAVNDPDFVGETSDLPQLNTRVIIIRTPEEENSKEVEKLYLDKQCLDLNTESAALSKENHIKELGGEGIQTCASVTSVGVQYNARHNLQLLLLNLSICLIWYLNSL